MMNDLRDINEKIQALLESKEKDKLDESFSSLVNQKAIEGELEIITAYDQFSQSNQEDSRLKKIKNLLDPILLDESLISYKDKHNRTYDKISRFDAFMLDYIAPLLEKAASYHNPKILQYFIKLIEKANYAIGTLKSPLE